MSGRLASQSGIPENKIVRSHFCTELSYLLNKQGGEYHALFNDPPSAEQFTPIGGVPRPDPDLADRTKYFAVPSDLQADYPERITPSRFSGKMREAAGCYYARGESIPFRHAYDKTHGIVWTTKRLGSEPAPVGSVAGPNVGNGEFGQITAAAGAKSGDFQITMLATGPDVIYSVVDPDGVALPTGAVGTPYVGGGLGFTIFNGGLYFALGDALTITVVGTTRYWLVEISAQGVYAAKLTVGAACCGSWSVSHLMPTDAEIKQSPGLREYRSKISLSWFRTFRGGSVVRQLLGADQVALAYQSGAPWCPSHGWAFSASGAQAQAVVAGSGVSPTSHYVGARFRINFQIVGTANITAALTVVEEGKKYTLMRDRTVWSPAIPGFWTGAAGGAQEQIEAIPAQDAPIHVFYAGETEQVTRWVLTRVSIPSHDTRHGKTFPPNVPWPGGCSAGYEGITYRPPPTSLEGGESVQATQSIACGFSGPGFAFAGDNYAKQTIRWTGHSGPSQAKPSGTNGNFFSLKEECWFLYVDPEHPTDEPVLVRACSQVEKFTVYVADFWGEVFTGTVSKTSLTSVVLFMEEREAVLAVHRDSDSESGVSSTDDGAAVSVRQVMETVSTSHGGQCPGYSWDIALHGNQSDPISHHAGVSAVNTNISTARARLALGSIIVDVPLATAAGGEISNSNFQTFLECTGTKTTAASVVFAMRGNINDTSRAYFLESMAVGGGFPYASGEVVAFVGGV